MFPLSDVSALAARQVRGCPGPVVRRAVLDAAREFCRRSTLVRSRATGSTLVTQSFTPPPPDSSLELSVVVLVMLDGVVLPPCTDESALALSVTNGQPVAYACDRTAITVYPWDAGAHSLGWLASWQPELTATSLPDQLSDYVEALADGAMARLFSMLEYPFGNGEKAKYHDGLFSAGVSRARTRAEYGHGRSVLMARR